MKSSLFDQLVNLEEEVVFLVYVKTDHGKREQHALLAIERYLPNNSHILNTYDFYPASHVDNTLFGNENRDAYNKIREGEVRRRERSLEDSTKEEVFEFLKIKDGLFYRTFRQGTCSIGAAAQLIQLAEVDYLHPPHFIYSGISTESDPVTVYNCITWVKHVLKEAGINVTPSFLTSLVENTTGIAMEECCGMNIPKVNAAETSPSCRIS